MAAKGLTSTRVVAHPSILRGRAVRRRRPSTPQTGAGQAARDNRSRRPSVSEAWTDALKPRSTPSATAEPASGLDYWVDAAQPRVRAEMVDARGLRLAQRIKQQHPVLRQVSREEVRAALREEAFTALPHLLPSEAERREAVGIVRRIGDADRVITPESEALLSRIERILGIGPTSAAPAPRPARTAARRKPRKNGAASPARPGQEPS